MNQDLSWLGFAALLLAFAGKQAKADLVVNGNFEFASSSRPIPNDSHRPSRCRSRVWDGYQRHEDPGTGSVDLVTSVFYPPPVGDRARPRWYCPPFPAPGGINPAVAGFHSRCLLLVGFSSTPPTRPARLHRPASPLTTARPSHITHSGLDRFWR